MQIVSSSLQQNIGRVVSIIVLMVMLAAGSKAAAAQNCTLYASPSGSATNSGTVPTSPLTLKTAAAKTQPGSVVCLLAGTYYVATPFEIPNSGTASAWITYTNYNGGAAIIAPASGSLELFQIQNPVRYIEIRGLQFNGQNVAPAAIACTGCDHLRVIRTIISLAGAAGIATYPDPSGRSPDYITADHNLVYHFGYNQGWGSAISYNRHGWSDNYQGFHSFVTNNIISGGFDGSTHHTDGGGIIMDDPTGWSSTPPVLIANNVVYENGGFCIQSRYATHIWIVNNTCYKNSLDLTINGGQSPTEEYLLLGSSGDYLVNNLAMSWYNRYSYVDIRGTTAAYYRNLWYSSGTGTNYLPSSVQTNSGEMNHANPVFAGPPYVNPSGGGQYNNAVPPTQITTQFYLASTSPAVGAGIDPTTIPNISSAIISDLRGYIYSDIKGNPRPAGSFDLGAYQSPTVSAGNPTVLYDVADSYVDSASPNTNYGSATPLLMGNSPGNKAVFLKFDLLSLAGKSISSAVLQFRVYDGAQGTFNLNAVADTSWTEAGITYLNRPTLGPVLMTFTAPVSGTYLQLDLTSLVKTNSGNVISLAISPTSTDILRLDSKEETSKFVRPQLIVR